MRDDPFHNGQQAYIDVKHTLVRGQRCLCAYCETHIADGTSDEVIRTRASDQRVEHFHPKSDVHGAVNWALHWPNVWAVCHGNANRPPHGDPADPDRYYPLPENLSCDAYKDHQVARGKLPASPEGWILAPNDVLAFPSLFQFSPDGTPEPHPQNCAGQVIPGNRHPDTATLVSSTIEHLNLGCMRLNRDRCTVKARLEKIITKQRAQSRGAPARLVLLHLARQLFPTDAASPWPEFFTLIRWRLGEPAEDRLRELHFAG
jgi:uncharacterized protein (TIGR02646 family)